MLPLKLNLDCKVDKRDYLVIMQGYTYKLEIDLFDNGELLDLTGVTVNVDLIKADKKFIIKTSGITKEGNKIKFDSDSDFTNKSGSGKMQIILKKEGYIFGSWVIDVVIKPSAINDNDGQSENKLTITQELKDTIAKANQTKTSLDESIANGEVASIKREVFNEEYETFITNKAMSKVGETTLTTYGLTTLEEPMLDEDVPTTLEEPILDESTEDENGIMTLEEPMIHANTTITPIQTGYVKEAFLKGKTLVNLITSQTPIRTGSNYKDYSIGYMKANQRYLAIFNAETSSNLLTCGILKKTTEWNGQLSSATNGVNKIMLTATTTDEQVGFRVRYSDSEVSHTLNVSNVMLFEYQDGMENWDIPYFEGMASVVNPSVTSVGKNFISESNMIIGEGVNSLTGEFVKDSTRKRTDFIKYGSNKKFALQGTDSIFFYDVNKNFISRSVDLFSTTPSNCEYIVCRALLESTNIQLEESTVATTYEPYKSNTVTPTEEVVLRRLPNGVCDTLNLLTGGYVQRIGEVTLNGSESWTIREDLKTEQTNCFYISVKDKKKLGLVLSDKLSTLTNHDKIADNTIEDFRWSGGYFFVHKNVSSVTDFKSWLQSNPVVVQYELATPIVKTVDLTGLPFNFKNGHIMLSSDSLLPTYEYIAPLTLNAQSETNALATQQINKKMMELINSIKQTLNL